MRNNLIRLAAIPLVMILYASIAEAGVIAWYPLHGDASAIVGDDGTLVADADGNGVTPAPDEKGNANGALKFQADPNNQPAYSGTNSGSYVNVAGGAGLAGLQQGTIAMWVNWSGMQGVGWQNRYGAVIARQSNGKYSNNVLGIRALISSHLSFRLQSVRRQTAKAACLGVLHNRPLKNAGN